MKALKVFVIVGIASGLSYFLIPRFFSDKQKLSTEIILLADPVSCYLEFQKICMLPHVNSRLISEEPYGQVSEKLQNKLDYTLLTENKVPYSYLSGKAVSSDMVSYPFFLQISPVEGGTKLVFEMRLSSGNAAFERWKALMIHSRMKSYSEAILMNLKNGVEH